MRIKQLFLLVLLTLCSYTTAKELSISVDLSPAGSFEINTGKVRGKIISKSGTLHAKKISVSVKKFTTGLELRDKHLKEKLQYKGIGKKISLENIVGKNGVAQGVLHILKKKIKVKFKYKFVNNYVKGSFPLSLKKVGLVGINYLGVGVKDKVIIKFNMKVNK